MQQSQIVLAVIFRLALVAVGKQILDADGVDAGAVACIHQQILAVLRHHQKAGLALAGVLRQALHPGDHVGAVTAPGVRVAPPGLAALEKFKAIYNVQIHAVKAGLQQLIQPRQNQRLPIGVPIAHTIVAVPIRVFTQQPGRFVPRPAGLPIAAVFFRLTDGKIRQHGLPTGMQGGQILRLPILVRRKRGIQNQPIPPGQALNGRSATGSQHIRLQHITKISRQWCRKEWAAS